MSLGEQVDLGNVRIHKKVIGDIAAASLFEISGVSLARFGLIGDLFELFGYKNFPGVYVTIDQIGQISLEIRVEVDYGVNISLVVHQIQDRVQAVIEKSLDIQLKEINVSVQSVVRSAKVGQGGF